MSFNLVIAFLGKVKVKSLNRVQLFGISWMPIRLLHPWDSPGKILGVGCHFLLQVIFLTQGSNPGLLDCRETLYCLSHWGSFFRRWGINTDQCEKENKNAHSPLFTQSLLA